MIVHENQGNDEPLQPEKTFSGPSQFAFMLSNVQVDEILEVFHRLLVRFKLRADLTHVGADIGLYGEKCSAQMSFNILD